MCKALLCGAEVCEDNFFKTETEDEASHGHYLEIEARGETFLSKFSRPRSRTRLSPQNFRDRDQGRDFCPQNFRDRDRGQDLVIISRPRGETFPLIFQDRGRDFLLNIFETKGQTRNGHFLKIEG